MELRDLEALVNVAEVGTMSGAAHKLNLTQPAMSALIRRLEEELATTLFVRHARGVSLTEEGQLLLEQAHQILADVSAAKSSLSELQSEAFGEVRVGLPTSVGAGLIPVLLERIRMRHPRIRLKIFEQMSGNLTELLQLGRLDMAILFDIQPMPGLRSEPVLVEDIALLVARDDPLGARSAVSLQELVHRDIVLPSPAHSIRVFVERAAATEGVSLRVSADIDSFFGLIGAVKAGFPTFLPPFLVADMVRSGEIHAVRIERPSFSWTLHLATRLDSVRPRAAMIVGNVIVESCSDLIRGGIWPGRLHPRRARQAGMPKS